MGTKRQPDPSNHAPVHQFILTDAIGPTKRDDAFIMRLRLALRSISGMTVYSGDAQSIRSGRVRVKVFSPFRRLSPLIVKARLARLGYMILGEISQKDLGTREEDSTDEIAGALAALYGPDSYESEEDPRSFGHYNEDPSDYEDQFSLIVPLDVVRLSRKRRKP